VRPYLEKNPSQKRTGGVAQGIGPGFKPQYRKKNKQLKKQKNKTQLSAQSRPPDLMSLF
jgi:hypothetical protein